tara:strand:- start:3930 stop:4412 length:483 start_codon:yes stop_codon:yes gene_type:complete
MKDIRLVKRPKSGKLIRQQREREFNFLKYWRVVRYYIKRKYDISAAELDMLLYLYDLPYFKKSDFNYYGSVMSWDKKRFIAMKRKDLIREWQRPGNQASLFELTSLGKTICRSTYKKLLGDEGISEFAQNNPVFKKETFSDKMYSELIKKMNSNRQDDTE